MSSTNTTSRAGLFASWSRRLVISCENGMHWQCERLCEIATHARLYTSRPQARLDHFVAKRTCDCECADNTQQSELYNNEGRQTCITVLQADAEPGNPRQGCCEQPDRREEAGRSRGGQVLRVALSSLSRRKRRSPSAEESCSLSMVQRRHFCAAFKQLVRVHNVRPRVLRPRHWIKCTRH